MQDKLNEILKNNHGVYSKVGVAAIATSKTGEEFKGVNVENAAYPSSMCAERSAMFNAISNGVKPGDIASIDLTSNLDRFLFPCAGCRQVMLELLAHDAVVNIWYKGKKQTRTLEQLVPDAVQKGSFGWK